MATADQRVDNPEPFEEQEPFLWDAHRYYTYASGVGSGKTAVGLIRAATNVDVWNPGYMGAIIAPTSTMIKNAIFPLMSEFGIRQKWDYKGPQSEEPGFHAPNGSRILILSADNDRTIERLAGLNLAWFWIDEARDVPERAIQILIQRLRKGRYKNGFLTSTPRRNHLEDFAFKNVDREDYSRWGDATVYEGEDRLTITGVTPDANPYVSAEDITAIRDAHPSGLLQQEVEGQFVDIGGGLLTRDMLTPVSAEKLDSRELSFHVGVDLGIEPDAQQAQAKDSDYFAAAIVGHHRRHGESYVIDVKRKRGLSLSQGVEWLKEVVSGVPSPSINVEKVHAQQYFLTAAKDAGLPVAGVNQTLKKEDRLIQLSIPFENDTIRLINFDTPPEEGLEDRWQQFIQEWIAFPDGTHDDMLDAVEIALRGLDIGASYGMTGVDMYGRDMED